MIFPNYFGLWCWLIYFLIFLCFYICFLINKKTRNKNKFNIKKCEPQNIGCWTINRKGLSASSSTYTIYSSCSTTPPTHYCSAGYFETDWWRPRKGGSTPSYLCMFRLFFTFLFSYLELFIVQKKYLMDNFDVNICLLCTLYW